MNRIRALVNNDLKKVEQSLSKLIQEKNAVYSELNKFLMSNSKRIRSILCLLYLKANNIDLTDDTLSLLIAGELIHNASLIHDDIIDSSEFRRNEKSLYKKFDSKIGVLLGDFLLSIAIEKLININNPIVSNAFLNTTKILHIGTLMSLLLEKLRVKLSSCLLIYQCQITQSY
jgi:octaprenyl-diphosphate synthase